LGFEPRVVFDGPVDTLVEPRVASELLATLREALSNVARHASASRVEISVWVGDGLHLRVLDDGVGFDPNRIRPGSVGVGSMRTRAEQLGGELRLAAGPAGGAELTWRVPLVDRPAS
jgi:signal transduction histidine kinase